MRIGMILNGHFAHDMRVRKESSALDNSGHEVFLLCLRKGDELRHEVVNGLVIERIDAGVTNYELAWWDIWMSVTGIHPKFKKKMADWLPANKIQVIHVHDLPLAGTALYYKRKLNIPVVLDLHENYPEALRAWFQWKRGILARWKDQLFMNPERWTKWEKKAVHGVDLVIAVVEEMKARLIQDHTLSPDRIEVVTNTEDLSFLRQQLDDSVYAMFGKSFIVLYSGGIGAHRGLDTAIKAMSLLTDYDIRMVIIGSGSADVIARLKSLVNESHLQEKVIFWNQRPFDKFYSYMRYAGVNIIPHVSNGHTENTIPHKLYHSMMVGRPVLVSTCAPLKRVVEETNSGLVFEAGNENDFAAKVLELYQNPSRCEQLGANGARATSTTHNWENTSKELVRIYNTFAAKIND